MNLTLPETQTGVLVFCPVSELLRQAPLSLLKAWRGEDQPGPPQAYL